MNELAYTAIFLAVVCVFVACFIKLLHYSIGEPKMQEDDISFHSSRIFGFFGRFILSNYIKAEQKERVRIAKLYAVEASKTNPDANVLSSIEMRHRGNIWMPLGVCPICFGTWISLLSWGIILIIFSMPLLWILLVAPTSTIISGRIHL